jgi:hypothetical protein
MQHKQWSDFSPTQRRAILALASLQLSLTATALTDIARRPAHQVRGPKWAWALASLVSFIGPLAYFLWGRQPAAAQ